MKILLDMNASPEWAEPLRRAGFECQHWSSIGDPRASDTTIFDWAAQNEYLIFTHDLDFGAILAATNARFPSVVQIRSAHFFPDSEKSIAAIVGYLNDFSNQIADGSLVTIDEKKARMRILPMRPL